jgi:branched-chain amino acid transport system ATP-binding protein
VSAPEQEPMSRTESAALELAHIDAGYGRAAVLRDVSLTVPRGSLVALLGPNGAGKTTLLRTASGLLQPAHGTVTINGRNMTQAAASHRAKAGLCLIPEGRGIFRNLSVRDNLRLQVPQWATNKSVDKALEVFPALRDRLSQNAGTLSGGQQQMLALARAYLAKPSVVLLDEVSMGLAPKIVEEIFETLVGLAATGVALLLVEQYVTRALEMADRVVLLNQGRVTFSGAATDLDEDAVMRGYFGADLTDGSDSECEQLREDPAALGSPAMEV